MDEIVIRLTAKEAAKLEDILDSVQDEGPPGEGWRSDEFQSLEEKIDKQISDKCHAIEQTDDFVKDEPLAFLVKWKDASRHNVEFELFPNVIQAARFAELQEQDVYPLYAGHPKSVKEARKDWC